MADTITPVYAFVKPEVAGSQHTWGGKINDGWDAIDAAIKKIDGNKSTAKSAPGDTDTLGVFGAPNNLIQWSSLVSALNAHFDARYPLASQIEAEAGVNNTKRMTPLRVKQAIAALGPNPKDNWGTQVVQHDATLVGAGTSADPLKRYVPPAPVITSVSGSVVTGVRKIDVVGTAEPNAVITLYRNGAVQSSTINADGLGNWSYTQNSPNVLATYTYTAKQFKNKNTSALSAGVAITLSFSNLAGSYIDVRPPSQASFVDFELHASGAAYKDSPSGLNFIGAWLSPGGHAPGCSVRFTKVSGQIGDLVGTFDVWQLVSGTRFVSLSVGAGAGTKTATVKVELSINGGTTINKTYQITLSASSSNL